MNKAKELLISGNYTCVIYKGEDVHVSTLRGVKPLTQWIEDGKAGKVAFVKGKWCGEASTEELLKELKITIRCLPLEQSGTTGKCLLTGKDATLDVIYARTY